MSRGSLETVIAPVCRDGWPFVGGFAAASVLLFVVATPLGWLGVVATAWCAYFFRDPVRVTPAAAGLVISPADGMVQSVDSAVPPPELELGPEPRPRVAVFMNVFNVHVNRIPVDGTVTRVAYRPGRFFNASLDKASEHNERQAVRITTPDGCRIGMVQIAGLVARRILCRLAEGQHVRAGERFGMIRFGSRVDVYLDARMVPQVIAGQRALAGETVIARALAPGENAGPPVGVAR